LYQDVNNLFNQLTTIRDGGAGAAGNAYYWRIPRECFLGLRVLTLEQTDHIRRIDRLQLSKRRHLEERPGDIGRGRVAQRDAARFAQVQIYNEAQRRMAFHDQNIRNARNAKTQGISPYYQIRHLRDEARTPDVWHHYNRILFTDPYHQIYEAATNIEQTEISLFNDAQAVSVDAEEKIHIYDEEAHREMEIVQINSTRHKQYDVLVEHERRSLRSLDPQPPAVNPANDLQDIVVEYKYTGTSIVSSLINRRWVRSSANLVSLMEFMNRNDVPLNCRPRTREHIGRLVRTVKKLRKEPLDLEGEGSVQPDSVERRTRMNMSIHFSMREHAEYGLDLPLHTIYSDDDNEIVRNKKINGFVSFQNLITLIAMMPRNDMKLLKRKIENVGV